MSGYIVTDLADQDLLEISLYIARQGGISAAERFVSGLKQKFDLLAATPGLGRVRGELAPDL